MKENLYEAECGYQANNAQCGTKERFVTETLATQFLEDHLKTYHGADLSRPSTVYFGWVKPYPPPPLRFRTSSPPGDNLNA